MEGKMVAKEFIGNEQLRYGKSWLRDGDLVIWDSEVGKKLKMRRIESKFSLDMLVMMDKKAFRNESRRNIWKRSGKVWVWEEISARVKIVDAMTRKQRVWHGFENGKKRQMNRSKDKGE